MSTPILTTKLYIPPPRPKVVLRPRLIERLNEGLRNKLSLISAPAGFGKTTLVSEWVAGSDRPAAWLSLDERDNDPTRFLMYLVSALQMIAAHIGHGVLGVLQSPQPPSIESTLTALLNEITTVPDNFILVLDDYHVIDSQPIDNALAFLLEHLPAQMHMVIATREDPHLPLARWRVRSQLTELRAADLRFTPSEAAGFLNQVMGLNLSAEDIAALDTRTEGWIAGLQLAAISMQGHYDTTSFIKSFTGSHRFVLDYLAEEVLHQQSESVQTFLLRTSILDRLCGPLCDAVLLNPSASGQATLEYIEHANLFIIPLDNERHWYRYHHLFADLLRQRLQQSSTAENIAEYHMRASRWYEDNGLEIDAFHHAVAANDLEQAARLVEGKGMPLLFRGAAAPVLSWLKSLPQAVLDARPSLWVLYASALLFASQMEGVEEKLQSAEAALQGVALDEATRDLIGHIASIRATMAVVHNQVETIVFQSRRALEYLHPHNLPVRTATTWTLGVAYQMQGDRDAAGRAYSEAIAISQSIGHLIIIIMATMGLGNIQENENQLPQAVETYQRALQLMGSPPLAAGCEAYIGLARIFYQWNDLDKAQQYGYQALQLARQIENSDRFVSCEVFLARLKLAQGDLASATALLAQSEQTARQRHFAYQIPDIAAAQVLTLIDRGDLAAAAHLAQMHELPLSTARVSLAQGDPSAALALLEPLRQHMEAKNWADERLKVMALQAIAHHARGEKEAALSVLGDTLALAAPSGFIRLFVDEGRPMAQLLTEAAARGIMPDYVGTLLAAFDTDEQKSKDRSPWPSAASDQGLIEPLSERELEILQLVAQGLSNHEISEQLFLALSTVKGHNRNIFDKLQVQRRTEAVARARELGLI